MRLNRWIAMVASAGNAVAVRVAAPDALQDNQTKALRLAARGAALLMHQSVDLSHCLAQSQTTRTIAVTARE